MECPSPWSSPVNFTMVRVVQLAASTGAKAVHAGQRPLDSSIESVSLSQCYALSKAAWAGLLLSTAWWSPHVVCRWRLHWWYAMALWWKR